MLLLLLLTSLLVSPAEAFTLPSLPQLHAAALRRLLLVHKCGNAVTADGSDGPIPPDAPTSAADDREKFQRSLLEASLVYDAAVAKAERTPARKTPAAASTIKASNKSTPKLAVADCNFTTPAEYENTR